MKNPFLSFPPSLRTLSSVALLALACNAQAQLTWDPDGNLVNDGGAGTWDTSTTNWDDEGSAPNVAWTNDSAAIFGSGSYEVSVANGGVTVGNLTYGGSGTLTLKSVTDNLGMITIKSGGATWDTGGGKISFFNDTANDTPLTIGSGDTLTINGGGQFDTGEKPTGAAWVAAGATLDITSATIVRGNAASVGNFATVKLAGGSTYIHERNGDQTYSNNWELGTGTVTFDNRWARNYTLSGNISGDGGMKLEFLANNAVILSGTNTFSGGIEVSTASRLQVSNAGSLGDASNNITLNDGGLLRLNGVDLGSTRQIILTGSGGTIVNDSNANTFGGKITGSGGLEIGNSAFNTLSNKLTLTGNTSDYTGVTTIHNGSIELGVNNALSTSTVLSIGGNNSTAQLIMAGFNAEIAGLETAAGTNNRQLNGNAAGSVLTLNVANGASYEYVGNVVGGDGNISIVKSGLGTQYFNRGGGYSAAVGNISANGGTLIWDVTGNTGSVDVASEATLQIGDGGTTGGVGSGVTASNIGNSNIGNDGSVSILRSAAFSYDGVISGAGGVTFSAGNGAVTLSSAQTYTGLTTIDKAVFTAQFANALSADSAVTVGGSGSGTSAFEMNGYAQEIGGFSFEPGTHTRELRNNGVGTTLTLNVSTGETYAFNGNVAGSGTIDLVKTGAGTQSFGRNGGYSSALGNVTVNGGELVWNNNNGATQTGAVNVGTGGTLSGSGVLGGAVTINGVLNPGNSPGTMTFNDTLSLTSLATLNMEIFGTLAGEFDILSGIGTNTLIAGGILNFDTTGYTATLGDSFTVLANWAGLSGGFNSITGTDLGGGYSFDTSNLLVNGTITVIPEPSAALLGGLGMLALLRRRRK